MCSPGGGLFIGNLNDVQYEIKPPIYIIFIKTNKCIHMYGMLEFGLVYLY